MKEGMVCRGSGPQLNKFFSGLAAHMPDVGVDPLSLRVWRNGRGNARTKSRWCELKGSKVVATYLARQIAAARSGTPKIDDWYSFGVSNWYKPVHNSCPRV